MALPPRNRSILICCMGTRGDVQPFVALALHLQQQRGWRAVLAAVSWGKERACLLSEAGRGAICRVTFPALWYPGHPTAHCCLLPATIYSQPPEFRGFITSYGLQHEDIGISLAHAFAASPQVRGS